MAETDRVPTEPARPRARELGIAVGTGRPGALNAITDVPGVRVGHCSVVAGEGRLRVGRGPVRTGVTVVLPHAEGLGRRPVFAGAHRLNGNGEMTGLEWVRESGTVTSPVGLTNTHSVGLVRDALVRDEVRRRDPSELYWSLPVVGETWDGVLSDVGGQHVRPEHVTAALEAAAPGPVTEGAVGAGTGMICHGFKGGIGTASRLAEVGDRVHAVGVLVLANHGRRERLAVNGVPVGARIGADEVPVPLASHEGGGSIIVLIATDAPLLPHQCTRLAQRGALGVGRTGGVGEHTSGDLMLAFSTGNVLVASDYGATPPPRQGVEMVSDAYIDALFDGVVEATEEAILNALLAARTTTGRDGLTAHALPAERLLEVLGARAAP
jgi:D-aminopeptidase